MKFLLGGIFVLLLSIPVLSFGADFSTDPSQPDFSTDPGKGVKLVNPIEADSFTELLTTLLQAAFVIGLPVAVLFIVFAGFRFVWARGNPTELEKAKKNLFYTVIGIAIFFGAVTLAKLIESTIKLLGI